MPRILIVALPEGRTLAETIRERVAQYYPNTTIATNEISAAKAAATVTDALIVLINMGWVEEIAEFPAYFAVIETALYRSDLMIVTATVDDASLPAVTQMPDALRALVYMSTINLNTTDEALFQNDLRRLASQVHMHFKEVEAEAQKAQAVPAASGRRGLPCNVLMILGALLIAGILVLIPALRNESSPVPEAFNTVVAPNNPAVLGQTAPDLEIMIGVAVGISEGNEIRGQEMLNGVALALADRPSVVIEGQRYTLDILTQDTGCSAIGGMEAARLFTTDPNIAGVIGDVCNLSCSAAAPIYDEADLTTISPGCTAPGLTLDGHSSFNRSIPSTAYAGTAAAQFAYETLGLRRAAIVYDELILGEQLASAFMGEFTQLGGEITVTLELDTLIAQMSAVVTELNVGDPALIYYAGRGRNAAQIREGLPQTPLLLGESGMVMDFIAEVQAAEVPISTEGVYTVTLLLPSGEAINALADRYADLHTVEPETGVFAYAYDAATMLIDAIEATSTQGAEGLILNRAGLTAYIRAYNGEGMTGSLACTGTGDCAVAEWQAWVIQDGELVTFEAE